MSELADEEAASIDSVPVVQDALSSAPGYGEHDLYWIGAILEAFYG